jgi:hypothetical protein
MQDINKVIYRGQKVSIAMRLAKMSVFNSLAVCSVVDLAQDIHIMCETNSPSGVFVLRPAKGDP